MCCGYGAMLRSRQDIFRPPLSEFSGFAPGIECPQPVSAKERTLEETARTESEANG